MKKMKISLRGSIAVVAISCLLLLTACGDDSSSVAPNDDELSSSSVIPGSDPKSSSSSAKSSSSKGKAKSSSSVKGKSSSSVIVGSAPKSSSSQKVAVSSSTLSSTEGSSSSRSSEGTIGSITDSRDGQTYKTVTIGTQVWMAQNLNYETANSYCYNDNDSNCTKYGRLYTWAAAMDSVGTWSTNGKGCGFGRSCSLPSGNIQGVCPEGWHLPTRTEWDTLFTAVGGSSIAGAKLMSTSGWSGDDIGTDDFSFSALPAGFRDYNGHYHDEGDLLYIWSSTEFDRRRAYRMDLLYFSDDVYLNIEDKDVGFSVRCLKD